VHFTALVVLENCPFEHAEQCANSAPLYRPARQIAHSVLLVECVPAGHDLQNA
jgi:hypothetical protein